MIINDLDGYYIVFDTKNWNTELDTLTNNQSGFNVVNINAKYSTAFKFGNFKLPISASYVLNPYNNKSYFTMSLYFGL